MRKKRLFCQNFFLVFVRSNMKKKVFFGQQPVGHAVVSDANFENTLESFVIMTRKVAENLPLNLVIIDALFS